MTVSRTFMEAVKDGYPVSEVKWKVLEVLKNNPDTAYTVKELASIINYDNLSSIGSCMRQLEREGYLWSKRVRAADRIKKGQLPRYYIIDKRKMEKFVSDCVTIIESDKK
jgi:DNA-binding MarR family transcriptional regulator